KKPQNIVRPFDLFHRPIDIIIKMQANKHLSFGDSQNITAPQSVPRLRKKNTPESVFLKVVLFCRVIFRRIR
ncbi:MAG: hypothetical protein SPK47_01605, partial [Eubacteriales bacterium]|nr:hypothetical protein [Clostridiales bacterium]MDY5719959.1 hypothetical protein [Eubacteriales bacterium]